MAQSIVSSVVETSNFPVLECRWLQLQAYGLGEAEKQVHVMYCSAACTLQKVVNH